MVDQRARVPRAARMSNRGLAIWVDGRIKELQEEQSKEEDKIRWQLLNAESEKPHRDCTPWAHL